MDSWRGARFGSVCKHLEEVQEELTQSILRTPQPPRPAASLGRDYASLNEEIKGSDCQNSWLSHFHCFGMWQTQEPCSAVEVASVGPHWNQEPFWVSGWGWGGRARVKFADSARSEFLPNFHPSCKVGNCVIVQIWGRGKERLEDTSFSESSLYLHLLSAPPPHPMSTAPLPSLLAGSSHCGSYGSPMWAYRGSL